MARHDDLARRLGTGDAVVIGLGGAALLALGSGVWAVTQGHRAATGSDT